MKPILKRSAAFIVVLALLISCGLTVGDKPVAASTSWPDGYVDMAAQSACLIDADTGAVLYEKDSHHKRYPASITKILTTLLTLENCKMDETITYSEKALECILEYDAANLGTKVGEKMKVRDALYGLMLHSANEVASALGEHISGSIKKFADLMNKRAKEAGAKDSHFANGNGLHNDKHYTTAYDMAMITKAALKYPEFTNIINTQEYTIPKNNKRKKRFFAVQRHKMIWEGSEYYYAPVIGGKTGYTDEAKNTLVTVAKKNGFTIISVIMKSDTAHVYTDTEKLLKYGFANFKSISVADNDTKLTDSNTHNLRSPFMEKTNQLIVDPKARVTLPKDASFDDLKSKPKFVNKNNIFSTVTYYYGDKNVGEANVTYAKPMKETKVEEVETKAKSIEKETTKEAVTKEAPKKSPGVSGKVVGTIIVVIVIILIFIIVIALIIRKKKKIEQIRREKRNRYRH